MKAAAVNAKLLIKVVLFEGFSVPVTILIKSLTLIRHRGAEVYLNTP